MDIIWETMFIVYSYTLAQMHPRGHGNIYAKSLADHRTHMPLHYMLHIQLIVSNF